jgi:hypothetical protein
MMGRDQKIDLKKIVINWLRQPLASKPKGEYTLMLPEKKHSLKLLKTFAIKNLPETSANAHYIEPIHGYSITQKHLIDDYCYGYNAEKINTEEVK